MDTITLATGANPDEDLKALKQLFDHGWIQVDEYKRLRRLVLDTCFGPSTDFYKKLQEEARGLVR